MAEALSVDALRQIDADCDRFEAEWRAGRQPRLEDFLQRAAPALRPGLLDALQKLQQELILKHLGTDPALDKTLDWAGARVIFRVVDGPHKGLEFIYDEHDTLLAGRSSDAQLRLKDDPHFSRNHFRLEVNPPDCYLMDLRSRNGTFVNGTRVTDRYLQDGDLISGGRTRIEVQIRSAPASPAPVPPPKPAPAPLSPPVVVRAAPPPAPVPTPAISRPVPAQLTPAQPAPPDYDEPVEIPGYQLHEQLGTGDLGTTFRATRLATGETCAVKIMAPAARSDEKAIQGFLREAQILGQLQHPHIVRMVDMGAAGSNLFLSTEFLPTAKWEELITKWTAAQRIRVACGLMVQILGALDYAHTRSLVHRDVKPGNLLIYRADGKLAAKLADFGLAKQYTMAGMSRMTREGDVIGSLPYMSPEQFINSREAKPTCDIYSAGATLYWLLTGYDPILLDNHPCKFLAILEDPPVPLTQRNPEVPAPLAQLVHRALEKTPEQRFAAAAEMRQLLRAFAK